MIIEAHQEPSIYLGSPGEEIGINDIQTIKQRFKRLSQLRERRIQECLQPRQRIFLELLPLLFQGNFKMLPGFISQDTPAGIPEYSPSAQVINAAKQFSVNFNYTRATLYSYPIEALFLMCSAGSIVFSPTIVMDVWLCHQSDLSPNALDELRQKTVAIAAWAESLGLEVHFFLIDSEQFRRGQNMPVSSEGSGQAQHLLLEAFYRAAIYIAGKSPAWWLVPVHEEANYSSYIQHLIKNRFIPAHELIDFGGFDAVPADEFIGASLWHLYKALHSPHKSLLKLLLIECYISEYPETEWLCRDIKKAVYEGDFMMIDLDPYFLIYQKVERFLKKSHNQERLSLARQSFYLQVMGSSDNTLEGVARTYRERYIQQIAGAWHWPTTTIYDLKQVRSWSIQKAVSEHVAIVEQLTYCYRMIVSFARDHVSPGQLNNNDLKLIGRKLHSFLEKKPGKVEIITTHSDVHSKETALSIVENNFDAKNGGWALYLKYVETTTAADFEPIQKSRTLIEILCWLIINGLYHKHLLMNFSAYSLKIPESELRTLLRQIDLFLSHNFSFDAPLEAYQAPRIPLYSMIIINMGILDNERICVMSERSDPLSYGADRQCFIQTTSSISLSSWSDITTSHEEGLDGLFRCLTGIINNNQKPLSLKNVKFVCYMPHRARDIVFRVEVIFTILVKIFSAPQQNNSPRYVLPGGTAFYVFQSVNKILTYKMLATEKLLLNEMALPQEKFSTIHFDSSVLENTPVHLIYSFNKPQVIQLFYYDNSTDISVYVVDEKGALYTQQHDRTSVGHVLKQYSVFLESIINRALFEHSLTIEYYEIQKSSDEFSCTQVQMKASSLNQDLSLRIAGEDTGNGIVYTIYCNEKEFSSLDRGNQVFYAAYKYIHEFRSGKSNYPIHITDIDLPLSAFRVSSPAQLQTIHYLNYKHKIEDKFNV